MFTTNKDILATRISDLRHQNIELRREIEKQENEIKNLEKLYQQEYKKLFELQLNNEQLKSEIEGIRDMNTNIMKQKENVTGAVKDVTNTICHSINGGILQSSTPTPFLINEDVQTIKQQLDATLEKFKSLIDDSSEDKYTKTKDKLLADLRVEQMAYEDIVKRLDNATTRVCSRNPTAISGNTWNMLIDEIKQSMFVKWYEFSEANTNRKNTRM